MLLLGAAALILFAFDKVAKRYKAEHSKWATAFMCAVLAALFCDHPRLGQGRGRRLLFVIGYRQAPLMHSPAP